MSTYGAEIEKAISDTETGVPKGVSQNFFNDVSRNLPGSVLGLSDIENSTVIKVLSSKNENHRTVGLDNAFNLQETASEVTHDLKELETALKEDLLMVQEALGVEGKTVINLSIHPLAKTDLVTYKAFVAPKGIYKFINERGWDHTAGIDAKAQNSPATGIEPENSAKAVTAMIGAGAAMAAIFGNSPFAEGEVSNYKETRLTMWERFMKNSISEGDKKTARFPEQPFNTLKDYFEWMFGRGTNMLFVMAEGGQYKDFGDQAIIINGNPSILRYLQMKSASGIFFKTKEKAEITPKLSHMADMQFAQFVGARIRWQFDPDLSIEQFLEAFEKNKLEDLLQNGGAKPNQTYIEGRDPGANFPDSHLNSIGKDVAWSTLLSPSAIQSGLLNNLEEASSFIRSFPWQSLKLLRESAIKDGLQGGVDGLSVYEFAKKIFELAAKGLPTKYHHMLAYPEYVLKTKQSGADRALKDFETGKSIQDIVKSRNVAV